MPVKSKPPGMKNANEVDPKVARQLASATTVEILGVRVTVADLCREVNRVFMLNPQEAAYNWRRFALLAGIRAMRLGEGVPEHLLTEEVIEVFGGDRDLYEKRLEEARYEDELILNRRWRQRRRDRDELAEARPTTRLFA